MKFAHLFHQLSAEPWYIAETAHAEFLSRHLMAFETLAARADAATDQEIGKCLAPFFAQRSPAVMEKETGIAHVSIFGPLARNLSPIQRATGMTDFAALREDIDASIAQGAKGILLHVDSPGGTVSGTPETAAMVAESPVPVVAHLARACSAAYYIAAGAQQLIASASGDVGSVGVMFPRIDMSRMLENAGIKMDTITNSAGDLKNITSNGALSEVQRKHLTEMADDMFADFRSHILAHRAVPDSAMRGQTMSGGAAVAANLVDSLGDAASARAYLLALVS